MLISVAPAGQNGHPSARTPTRLWLRVTVPPSALSLSRSVCVTKVIDVKSATSEQDC
jgi:hypothetical protein